jgi:hypothetical protein
MKFKLIIAVCLIINVVSCTKDINKGNLLNISSFLEMVKLELTEDPISIITIHGQQYAHDASTYTLDISAKLDNSYGGLQAINQVQVEKFGIKPDLNPDGRMGCQYSSLLKKDNVQPNQLFGKDILISLTTQTVGNLSSKLKLPDALNFKVDGTHKPIKVSKTKGIDLSWNRDGKNKLPLLLNIMYLNQFSSKEKRDNLPKKMIQISKLVSDDGKLSINPDELTGFPAGGMLNISLTRGGYKVENLGEKKALIYGASIVRTLPIEIID